MNLIQAEELPQGLMGHARPGLQITPATLGEHLRIRAVARRVEFSGPVFQVWPDD